MAKIKTIEDVDIIIKLINIDNIYEKNIFFDELNSKYDVLIKPEIELLTNIQLNEAIKVVANIPYYITSPIIAHLLGEIDDLDNKNRERIKDIILMVQEEVARRIVATEKSSSKQYGLLTILSQFWADCSILKLVGRKSFYPAPKVTSALVKFTFHRLYSLPLPFVVR